MVDIEVKHVERIDNPAVATLVSEEGRFLHRPSRAAAEALARELSRSGERVRIQRAAPQEPSGADLYLVRFPRRYTHVPRDDGPRGLTYDVSANQYGELGRSLVVGSYGVSPPVKRHLFRAVDGVEAATHRIRGVVEPPLPEAVSDRVSWSPDCLLRAVGRPTGAPERSFYAEVKTGDASFQRGQLEDMRTAAAHVDVLKIRVVIEDLPASYTVRISEVEPDGTVEGP